MPQRGTLTSRSCDSPLHTIEQKEYCTTCSPRNPARLSMILTRMGGERLSNLASSNMVSSVWSSPSLQCVWKQAARHFSPATFASERCQFAKREELRPPWIATRCEDTTEADAHRAYQLASISSVYQTNFSTRFKCGIPMQSRRTRRALFTLLSHDTRTRASRINSILLLSVLGPPSARSSQSIRLSFPRFIRQGCSVSSIYIHIF